jgi:hypothetical protein
MLASAEGPGGARQWRIYSVRFVPPPSCGCGGASCRCSVAHAFKAHMRSIYRKLDATIRNQAITRARELGLIEG